MAVKVQIYLVAALLLLCCGLAWAVTLCTISGQVLNVDGTVAANSTITFNPVTPQPLTTGGASYTSQPVSTQTDANGNMTPITLPQGLMVQITIYQNGANQGGYTAIVPFISAVSFVQMNQGINTQPLNVLASAQPPTGPLNLNGQQINNVGCPAVSGDALVQGCGNTIANILVASDIDFGLFNLLNVGGINLVQQPPVTSITGLATCTGICATVYTYEITCVTSTGETNASAPVTLSNAATLTSANNNNLTWPSTTGASCNQGYNIYGRINGSLGFLTNVPQGTNTFTDNGSIPTPVDSWTLSWNKPASPAVAIWDLRGTSTTIPVDVFSTNSGQFPSGPSPVATGITTNFTNDTQIPIFSINKPSSGTLSWPAFPAGFSSLVQINPSVTNVTFGLEGGTKTIAAAGAVPNTTVTFSPSNNLPWATINIAMTPANVATPATIVSTLNPVPVSPYTSVTFGDPAGATSGDVMVVCTSYLQGATLVVPSTFNFIAQATYKTGNVQTACYWTLPNGAFGRPPPTVNTTGGITQLTANGQTLNALQPPPITWQANSGSAIQAVNNALASTSFPLPMTVVGCRNTFTGLGSCTGAPTYAMLDATTQKVICQLTTTISGSGDGAAVVTLPTIPANDVVTFAQTGSPLRSCSTGSISMTIVVEPPL